MSPGVQDLDHERETDIAAGQNLVEECLVRADDDGEARPRAGQDRLRVGAVRGS
jgi:hypothetical protein